MSEQCLKKMLSECILENVGLKNENKRYREALEEIMKIDENHKWNLYGLAYSIAEKTLSKLEVEE